MSLSAVSTKSLPAFRLEVTMTLNNQESWVQKMLTKITKHSFATSLIMSIYVSYNSFFSKNLWFWWDELTILTSQSSHFLGLLQNHEGNFFPLGRLFFLTETLLFRGNYGLYVAANSLLVCLIMKLLYETLGADISPNLISKTLLMFLVGGFGLNVGVLYDSQWGLQICWFSSVGFILVGSYLCIKKITTIS